jgi:hypothetical protein
MPEVVAVEFRERLKSFAVALHCSEVGNTGGLLLYKLICVCGNP